MANIRVVKIESKNPSAQDELEYFMLKKILGNIQLYFDNVLVFEVTDQDHPDYDEDNSKLMPSFKD